VCARGGAPYSQHFPTDSCEPSATRPGRSMGRRSPVRLQNSHQHPRPDGMSSWCPRVFAGPAQAVRPIGCCRPAQPWGEILTAIIPHLPRVR